MKIPTLVNIVKTGINIVKFSLLFIKNRIYSVIEFYRNDKDQAMIKK